MKTLSSGYTASHVANFFLDKASAEGRDITNLKLLKLVYIAYGWYLALVGKQLFVESVEAWTHGPVIPSIYHEFKHFRRAPIADLSSDLDLDTMEVDIPRIPPADEETTYVLNTVWEIYKNFTASGLVNKTHAPGTPWSKTWDEGRGSKRAISPDLIKDHFESRIAEYLETA